MHNIMWLNMNRQMDIEFTHKELMGVIIRSDSFLMYYAPNCQEINTCRTVIRLNLKINRTSRADFGDRRRKLPVRMCYHSGSRMPLIPMHREITVHH